jgi:tetratricopeptide (TPR) repeat protein
LGVAALLVAGAAYWNSFRVPFVFDDARGIASNLTIRHLWPLSAVLSPTVVTLEARPVPNLTLAINYGLGGLNVWGYHLVNLGIHLLAGLVLFGLVRRTLSLSSMPQRCREGCLGLAFTVALLWLVHPLQTEAVTYVVQRSHCMMALFYLLVLYALVRGATAGRGWPWYILALAACLLGMGCTEEMVSAPLIALLFDRACVGGSFRVALRRRWGLYLGLGATWGLLAFLVVYSGVTRGGTAGFGGEMTPWQYLRTQFGVIVHYLRLVIWPHPLVIDYGRGIVSGMGEILPYALVVVVLLSLTVVGLVRNAAAGFLGAFFFATLAPTSSFIPLITQTAAEKRMYLPLAAVIALAVVGCYTAWGRLQRRWGAGVAQGPGPVWPWLLVFLLACILVGTTIRRNTDYRSGLALWQATVDNLPNNPRAQYNLAKVLADGGDKRAAAVHYELAIAQDPGFVEAHYNLGNALLASGRLREAIMHYEQAVKLQPGLAEAQNNLGIALVEVGQVQEAITHYEAALRLAPDDAEVRCNLANALAAQGRWPEALAQYERALVINPGYAEAHDRRETALRALGSAPR